MNTNKNSRLKGSVLFTVVSVMSLLIIFLTGTLVLAASANKRAHRTYCTSQAEYTARAAIESFTEAMSHNPDIAGAVINLNDTIYPYVDMDSSGMGTLVCDVKQADGSTVNEENRIKVEKLGDSKYYYTSNGWEALQTVKVTATARVGKEEKSVSIYIRKKAPNEIKPSPLKGLQTAGGNNADLTEGTYTGALVVGALEPASTYALNNGTVTNSDINFINGNLKVSGDGLTVNVKHATDEDGNPSGTVIMGDLICQNKNVVNVAYVPVGDFNHKQIPYLFVEGKITDSNTDAGGAELVKGNGAPFNIYARELDFSQASMKWESADVYLFGDDANTVSKITAGKDQTLFGWTYSVLNKTTEPNSEGGSIYTKASLELNQAKIHGDLRVEKNLIIDDKVEIIPKKAGANNVNGDIVVGGGIYFNKIDPNTNLPGSDSLKGARAIYCDHFYAGYNAKPGYTEVEVMPTPKDQVINLCGEDAWTAAGGDQYGPWGACLTSDYKILKLANWDGDKCTAFQRDSDNAIVSYDEGGNNTEIALSSLNGIPIYPLSARPSEYNEIYPKSMTKDALLGAPGYEKYKVVKTLKEIRESLNITMDELTGDPIGFDTTIYPKKPADMEKKIGKTFDELRGLGYSGSGAVTKTTYFTGDYSGKVIEVEPASDDVWLVFENAKLDAGTVIVVNDKDHPVKIALIGNLDLNNSAIITKAVYDQVKGADGKVDTNKVATINAADKINVTWYGTEGTTISCVNDCTISGTAKLPFTSLKMKVQGRVKAKYVGTYATTPEPQVYAWIGGALLHDAETCNNFRMAYCEEGSGGSSSSEIKTAGGTYIISHYDQY